MMNLFEIYKIYFLIGLQLFGGGYVILPLLKKYLVEERNWMKEEELIDYLALSQCLPGIIALNVSIFSGWKLKKLQGAIMAILGLLTPSFVIILLVAGFVFNVAGNKFVQNAFFGIRLSVIVLISFMVYDIFKKSVNSLFAILLFILILSLILFTGLTPTLLILISILIAVIKEVKFG